MGRRRNYHKSNRLQLYPGAQPGLMPVPRCEFKEQAQLLPCEGHSGTSIGLSQSATALDGHGSQGKGLSRELSDLC